MSNFINAIKQAALGGEELYLKLCTVDAVDEEARTISCTPYDDGAQLIDVRLQAADATGGLLTVPKIGSEVVVGYLDSNNAVVLLFAEIDKIKLDALGIIEINGGENGGMVKVEAMVEWMKKVHSDLQTLKTQLSIHSVAGNGAPLGLTFNPTAPNPVADNFSNLKITH